MFWPTKVGNKVVAFRNLGNGKLCKILSSANGKINCLSADVSIISTKLHLESILTLATEDTSNRTQNPKIIDVKLSYSESKTHAWNSSVSLKLLGVKTTIQTTVPLIIAKRKTELSGEFSGDYQWRQTESLTTNEEKMYKVSVPSMTMVRMNLIATKASCDIPFSYE
ncbi:hypothetical protein ACSBR2_035477 [Camellia fascicularis]